MSYVNCTLCGALIASDIVNAHLKACSESAAAQEQLRNTYYGYPKGDVDLLEALIRIRETNPDSIEAGYNRKES